MVLNWKPACKVIIDGTDVSGVFLDLVSSITVTDGAGVESDKAEILLSDAGPFGKIEIPPAGAEMEIAIGYGFSATTLGRYIVDEIEVSGPPDVMRITAYAATMGPSSGGKQSMTDPKSRSWPSPITVGDLVRKIAGDQGFTAAVTSAAAALALPHLDQIDESDMNLLTRVAREMGLIFKPGGGALVMSVKGESVSAGGQRLPTVALTPRMVTSWSMQIKRREAAQKVVASYRDIEAAAWQEVEAIAEGRFGSDPALAKAGVAAVRRLKRTFPDEASAKRAAQAELDRGAAKSRTLSLTLPGRPDLMAEGRLTLAGFRQGVNGPWLIEQVTHQLDGSGYRCSVSAESLPG